MLVELMQRYLNGLLDPLVTPMELQKLMYFMQEAGEPLQLKYTEYDDGLYAKNLRHLLNAADGHLIEGYVDAEDAQSQPLSLVCGAVEARQHLAQNQVSRSRLEQVARLIDGFESSVGLELLATVHWMMNKKGSADLEDVACRIQEWNLHKRKLSPRQLAVAEKRLKSQGWLPATVAAR